MVFERVYLKCVSAAELAVLRVERQTAAMMMRLLQAESAALNPLFQSGWLLSCHRPGCGFAVRGTVSRKSSFSPFHFKAKQRKIYSHKRKAENNCSR